MAKIFAVGIWVLSIVVAGIKVKYPEIGTGLEDILTGAMGVATTSLLFTPAVHK
jgi:hypothetical protein